MKWGRPLLLLRLVLWKRGPFERENNKKKMLILSAVCILQHAEGLACNLGLEGQTSPKASRDGTFAA